MSQQEFDFARPAHCLNCDPARDEANLSTLEACGVDFLSERVAFTYEMDLSRCTPEEAEAERFHMKHRKELFVTALSRRRAA